MKIGLALNKNTLVEQFKIQYANAADPNDKKLDLSGNKLGKAPLAQVIDLFEEINKHGFTELDLSCNAFHLSEQVLNSLLTTLKEQKSLTFLGLATNRLACLPYEKLYQAMETLSNIRGLEVIDLSSNNFSNLPLEQLNELLKLFANKSLKTLIFDANQFHTKKGCGAPEIAALLAGLSYEVQVNGKNGFDPQIAAFLSERSPAAALQDHGIYALQAKNLQDARPPARVFST